MKLKKMNQNKVVDPAPFTSANAALDAFKKGGAWPPTLELKLAGAWNGMKGEDAYSGNNLAVCRLTGRQFLYDLEGTSVCDVRER